MKNLHVIESEQDYKAALQRIEEIPLPDPIEAIKIRMDDFGLKAKDLIPAIGDKGTVSKILNRKILFPSE